MKNLLFLVLVLFLSGCQNGNFFGWLHKEGADKSPEALLADAEAALNEDNPTDAKNYAEEILKNDPDNSEALYIHAQATLQEAGFDLGGIISNAIKSKDDAQSADSLIATFEKMDLNQVAKAINTAVEDLKKIVTEGDGSISPTDVDVNLNLGILEVLDAAIDIVDFDNDFNIVNDTGDIIQIDENYTVTIKGEQVENFNPDTLSDEEKYKLIGDPNDDTDGILDNAINQVSDAANRIQTAAESAGLLNDNDTSTIEDLKNNIEGNKESLKEQLVKLQESLQ